MLTYVIRRLLYSIVVLFAASVLVFWGMSLVTSPIGFLRMQPGISEQTIHNIEQRKHLDRPIYVRYGYWMKDVVTNKFGTETINDTPIFPDLKRAMGHTLQLVIVAELLAILLAVGIGVYSALRQYSVFDYTATTASFRWSGNTRLLARAHAAGAVREHLPRWFDVRIFYRRRSERASIPVTGLRFAPRPCAAPRVCRSSCSWWPASRQLLSVHARLDARGRQCGLRANGTRQGPRQSAKSR